MSRFIEMGDRKWKPPPPREWPWQKSAKGNWYTRVGDRTAVILTFVPRDGGKVSYKYSLTIAEDKWASSEGVFDTLEEAKKAALRALGIGARQPVQRDDRPSGDPPPPPSTGRRIVL